MTGSQHNDPFVFENEQVKQELFRWYTGRISNGMPICFDVVFKPTATISQIQQSINENHDSVELEAKDVMIPVLFPEQSIVESMTALVLCDHLLVNRPSLLKDKLT